MSVFGVCLYAVPETEVLQMAMKEKENTEKSATEKEDMAGVERSDEKMVENQGLDNAHYKDSSGKTIFENPILCSQFLRDYVDIPLLKDVQPEDIEDVTERFIHMFTEERDADVVKKINLKNNSFFVISLIEHKSNVDYNLIMQVFRYITFIWEDYEKEQEKARDGISKTKEFRYPPILPIVFYDGVKNWTAATSLHERVFFSDILGKYIPDYQCLLVQLKDYSNAELMEKKNELSVLMLIEKLRNATDYEQLEKELDKAYLEEAIEGSPQYLLKVMSQIIEVFLAKLNVPREEANAFTDRIKERKMGELFKHFEGWDIQAVRREAKEEVEKAREEARKEAREEARKEAREEARKEVREEVEKEVKENKIATAKRMLAVEKYALEEIADISGLSLDEVELLKEGT